MSHAEPLPEDNAQEWNAQQEQDIQQMLEECYQVLHPIETTEKEPQ